MPYSLQEDDYFNAVIGLEIKWLIAIMKPSFSLESQVNDSRKAAWKCPGNPVRLSKMIFYSFSSECNWCGGKKKKKSQTQSGKWEWSPFLLHSRKKEVGREGKQKTEI